MGNHSIGQAMVAVAVTANERRKPNETALDILDLAAERTDIRGMDAEFDDATNPDEAFGAILKEAFCPDFAFPKVTDEDSEAGWDDWYERAYRPFRARYDLC